MTDTRIRYRDVYRTLKLPRSAERVAFGDIAMPELGFVFPFFQMGFPPALIPIWTDPEGPFHVGFWHHFLVHRHCSIVKVSVGQRYRVYEKARTTEQLFSHWLIESIDLNDGLTEEVRQFASSVGIVNLDYLQEVYHKVGTLLSDMAPFEPFVQDAPLSCFSDDVAGYAGDFPHVSRLSMDMLRTSCALEWSPQQRSEIASMPGAPPWYTTQHQPDVFSSLVESGDLSGAWMSLNSPGWQFEEAKHALRRLAALVDDQRLQVLTEAWTLQPHETAGAY